MALLKTSLALLTLGARLASAQISDEELDQANKNSECTNDCFFDVWTDGQCTDDPACMCNFHDTREEYFCCIAEKCDTGAWECKFPSRGTLLRAPPKPRALNRLAG